MTFVAQLRARATERARRIVLAEGEDERTLRAAVHLARTGEAVPLVVLGPRTRTVAQQENLDLRGIELLDPGTDPRRPQLADHLWQRRQAKGLSRQAAEAAAVDPLLFAALLVATGHADGTVAGAVNTTGNVLRAALQAVGTAPGIRTVSSSFYMMVPPFRDGAAEVLTFTDAAVVPNPTAEQLADIAVAAVAARGPLVGDEPRVAFLSYSTLGSAAGPDVEKVRAALARFRQRAPHVAADGELQADAALVPGVGARKAPASAVAGQANILVFPDLNAGNIAYKLVQRLARATALGPIVQGLHRPCNDLSRGATTDDIINVACATALLAA